MEQSCPELTKHALSEGMKACTKYGNQKLPVASKWTNDPKSCLAGLVVPVTELHKYVVAVHQVLKVSNVSPADLDLGTVFASACTEYISAEVLELGGNCCRDHGRTTLNKSDIFKAIERDEELVRTHASRGLCVAGCISDTHAHPLLRLRRPLPAPPFFSSSFLLQAAMTRLFAGGIDAFLSPLDMATMSHQLLVTMHTLDSSGSSSSNSGGYGATVQLQVHTLTLAGSVLKFNETKTLAHKAPTSHFDIMTAGHAAVGDVFAPCPGAAADAGADADGGIVTVAPPTFDGSTVYVRQVTGTSNVLLALGVDGSLFYRGDGALLGCEPSPSAFALYKPMARRQVITNVAASEHATHTLLLSSEGKVYSVGSGSHGQLGHRNTTQLPMPKCILTNALRDEKAVAVAVTATGSAAVTATGKLVRVPPFLVFCLCRLFLTCDTRGMHLFLGSSRGAQIRDTASWAGRAIAAKATKHPSRPPAPALKPTTTFRALPLVPTTRWC